MRTPPTFPARLAVAIAAGIVGGLYCYFSIRTSGGPRAGDDFTWHWLAARALIEGHSPYLTIHVGGPYQLDAPYVYPLTTAIAAIPFSLWLSPVAAAASWIGFGSALMAYAVTRNSYNGLLMFGSLPYLWAASAGQFSPLLVAAALLPWLGFLTPVKPQLGVASLSLNPSRIAIGGSIAFVLATLLAYPHWPAQWIAVLPQRVKGVYVSPVTVVGGFLMLLALLRWKRPEARLLLVMSLVPQSMLFYDQLLLWLIPRTQREYILLGTLSMVAPLVASRGLSEGFNISEAAAAYAPAIIAFIYLPCLIMVLRRPNESPPPGHGS